MEAHDDCKKELFAVCTKTNYVTLIKKFKLFQVNLIYNSPYRQV